MILNPAQAGGSPPAMDFGCGRKGLGRQTGARAFSWNCRGRGVEGGLVADSEERSGALVASASTVRLGDEDSAEGAPTTQLAALDDPGRQSTDSRNRALLWGKQGGQHAFNRSG